MAVVVASGVAAVVRTCRQVMVVLGGRTLVVALVFDFVDIGRMVAVSSPVEVQKCWVGDTLVASLVVTALDQTC